MAVACILLRPGALAALVVPWTNPAIVARVLVPATAASALVFAGLRATPVAPGLEAPSPQPEAVEWSLSLWLLPGLLLVVLLSQGY